MAAISQCSPSGFPQSRKFVELMKSLGYQRSISLDSFRTPNFQLVADCLHWLIKRYDPACDLDYDISTEAGRVTFVQCAARLMLQKAKIKLQPKQIYSADYHAVVELMKVAAMLRSAADLAAQMESHDAETVICMKAFDVKAARTLILDIVKSGATLYDNLANEAQLEEARNMAMLMNTEIEELERTMKDATSSLLTSVLLAEQEQISSENEEKSLQALQEKHKSELERCEKRFSVLENVRPAYVDEYESLQKNLQGLFTIYLEKFHNLQWLESQLKEHNLQEQEKVEESYASMRRLQQQLYNEDLGSSISDAESARSSNAYSASLCVPLVMNNTSISTEQEYTTANAVSLKEASDESSEDVGANEDFNTDDDF